MNLSSKEKNKGFTLVEMLVSVGIFTIVMTIAIGALLVVYDAYRKTRTLKNAMDNVNISTESMIKKIRTGDKFSCAVGEAAEDALGFCPWVRFRGKDGNLYEYSILSNATTHAIITRNCVPPGGSYETSCSESFQPITSPDVEITNLRFHIYGARDNSSIPLVQDSVTVTVTGYADIPGKSQFDSSFRVQTTVSKRLLDTF